MDAKTYRQKEQALIERIENYHADNAEHEIQIALNNKQIVELDAQRTALYYEYMNGKEPAQRNLQGEIIKKGK